MTTLKLVTEQTIDSLTPAEQLFMQPSGFSGLWACGGRVQPYLYSVQLSTENSEVKAE